MKNEADWELIHAYTRKQAIEDGVLVDVSEMAKEAGYRIPVALTQAVWVKCVEVPPSVQGQDEAGRLWDLLWMCRLAINRNISDLPEVLFQLHVRNDNRSEIPPSEILKAGIGPDDDGSPCITIMMIDED